MAHDDFSSLFDLLPIGAYRSLPNGAQLRANPALARLNGYETEAEQLESVRDIGGEWYVEPSRREDFMREIETHGRVTAFESEVYRHKSRERIWISENAHVVHDAAGRVLFYEGTVEEITQRVRDREALRQAGENWKRALESSGDGVWDWWIAEGREELSPGCLALYGYAPGELPDTPDALDRLTHPDDVPAMRRARDEHLAGRSERYTNEHRVRCRDGSWKWVLSRGVVISRDGEGRPLRMIGTHTDITAERAAAELLRQRDRAAAAHAAKSQFLSRVSHELRTPLNAILGFAQLLELDEQRGSGAAAGDPARRALWQRQLRASGVQLLALVNDVLDLSAAQSGELRVVSERVPLRPLVDEALALLATQAQEAGVSLEDETPAGGDPQSLASPAWRADHQRALQVLANLVSNAIKYNRRGGWVRLALSPGPGELALHVADSGRGLDAAQIGRLFQPFERLGAHKSDVGGTGLGLALARQLTQAMGGRLTVQSTPGSGSTFTLTLPAA